MPSFISTAVYRVNFLRARARMFRWSEEKSLLLSEIIWTQLYFRNQASRWNKCVTGIKDGKDCYAKKQAVLWESMAKYASSAHQLMVSHQHQDVN